MSRDAALHRAVCVALSAMLATAPPLAAALPPPLYVIPVESRITLHAAHGGALQVDLTASNPEALAQRLGRAEFSGGKIRVMTGDARIPYAAGHSDWLGATFVIDHGESSVARLYRQFRRRADEPSLRPQLERFVNERVAESMDRDWDFASEVASSLRGDCTEHAVLLAALARRSGIPARVVIGVVIVVDGGTAYAAGHAWNEVRSADGASWERLDAALHGIAGSVYYLRGGVLEEEGPGFALPLAHLVTNWVDAIEITGWKATSP